jgi:hypothetical protein
MTVMLKSVFIAAFVYMGVSEVDLKKRTKHSNLIERNSKLNFAPAQSGMIRRQRGKEISSGATIAAVGEALEMPILVQFVGQSMVA